MPVGSEPQQGSAGHYTCLVDHGRPGLVSRQPGSTMMESCPHSAPSSRGLEHGPFKAATRVRIPSGSIDSLLLPANTATERLINPRFGGFHCLDEQVFERRPLLRQMA